MGRRALALQMDVTERASVEAAAKEARGFGPISILVNNAGINKPTDFDYIADEDWDTILATNLRGPFVCAQVFLPLLAEAGGGGIVHIGSVSGQYGGPRTAHYAASKAGLISLAQVIARFGAPHGVRSNTVAAGLIASDMASAGMAAASVQKAAEAIILKRLGSAAKSRTPWCSSPAKRRPISRRKPSTSTAGCTSNEQDAADRFGWRRSGRCRAPRQRNGAVRRGLGLRPRSARFRICGFRLIADVYGPSETAAAAERYNRKIRKIDGVICVAADAPLTTATVAERLGLPGISRASAELACDKLAMKRACRGEFPFPGFRKSKPRKLCSASPPCAAMRCKACGFSTSENQGMGTSASAKRRFHRQLKQVPR